MPSTNEKKILNMRVMNNIKIRAQKLAFSPDEKHSALFCRGWFTSVGNDSNTLKSTLFTMNLLLTLFRNIEKIKLIVFKIILLHITLNILMKTEKTEKKN